jgi:hypothetical protein
MRCPSCGSRVTTLAADDAAAPGTAGKTPLSCASCQTTFLLDERASIVSVRDGARNVRRPEGIVIFEDTVPEGPIYRSAHKDMEVRLGVFAPHFGRLGPILLAVVCGWITVTLMRVFRDWDGSSYLPLWGVLGFYVLTYIGYSVWPKLRGPSHQLALTREAVIAVEHGREVARCLRDEIGRVVCGGAPAAPAGRRGSVMRYHLAAYDRSGRRFLLWQDISPDHGAFAEAWLEERLGLSSGDAAAPADVR